MTDQPSHMPTAAPDPRRPYQVACDLYAQTLAILARRAGANYVPPSTHLSEETIRAAQTAALPRQAESDRAQTVLASIMGRLHHENRPGYYRPAAMTNAAVMPQADPPSDLPAAHAEIWGQLHAELVKEGLLDAPAETTPHEPVDTRVAAQVAERRFHAILQRYAWAVAAPPTTDDARYQENTHATVSLYDYARVAAALAVCLDWPLAANTEAESHEPVLLVGGDLSGVQEWLYTFGSGGAAKSLRGRSFYLQLLTEVIAHYLLDELGLPLANLLYVGGGNFYLLVPAALAGRVQTLQQTVSRKLLTMHNGALYVAVAHAPLPLAVLRGEDPNRKIGAAWDHIARKLNGQKSRRFAELEPAEMARAIGAPLDNTGKLEDTCRVCRRFITQNERGKPVEDAQGGRVCDLCNSFEQLGNLLPQAEFLVWSRVAAQEAELVTQWQSGLQQLGYDVQIVYPAPRLGNREDEPGGYIPPSAPYYTTIYFWGDKPEQTDFPNTSNPPMPEPQTTVWAYRPLAQCTPLSAENRVATFDELQSTGIKRWGVLRMDVDNLGRIFQQGIPAQNMCSVVAISGLMRHFFEGYVPQLADETFNAPGAPRVYLMYAGGDDLFVVGGWSDLPLLAERIHTEFTRFVCQNPQITISGGISLALDEKYPLYQAARDAGEAEHAAKDYGKNALAFLGQPMRWKQEFKEASQRQADIRRWLGANSGQASEAGHDARNGRGNRDGASMARGFLMALRALAAEWEQWCKQEGGESPTYRHNKPDLYLGPWQWHLVYTLSRAAERAKDDGIKDEVHEYIQALLEKEIRTAGVTARWVELLTRVEKDTQLSRG